MKFWKIPIVWEESAIIECEANTLEEAMEIARDKEQKIPIPESSSYVDDTWRLSIDDVECIRQFYNSGQQDDNTEVKND